MLGGVSHLPQDHIVRHSKLNPPLVSLVGHVIDEHRMKATLVLVNKETQDGTAMDTRDQIDTVGIRQYFNKDLSRYAATLGQKDKVVHRLSLEVALWSAGVVLTLSNVEILVWLFVLVQYRFHGDINPHPPVEWYLTVLVGLDDDHTTDGFPGCQGKG